VAKKKKAGKEDLWRTRRVLGLCASGESTSQISQLVGWSEGRVRKVLREAGVVVREVNRGRGHEE
jgi:hypothetical protein